MSDISLKLTEKANELSSALENVEIVVTSAKEVEDSAVCNKSNVSTLGIIIEQLTGIVNQFKI
jgi:hypothetical protein